MKVSCSRDALLTACQIAGSAVAPRTTRPILSCLKFVAEDGTLTIMGTDLEIGIRYTVPGAKVARQGVAIISPARLVSILREASDDEITLTTTKEATTIRLSVGRFECPNGDPEEFPDLPAFPENATEFHEMAAGPLRSLIKRTAFAADRKEGQRWATTAVLWQASSASGSVQLVATDTKRLALASAEAAVEGNDSPATLIPAKAVALLERNLSDGDEAVRVALRNNEAMFRVGPATIHTKLVEGRFPPYRDIMPKKFGVKIALPVPEFMARVRQAAIMTDDESKRVDFHFAPGEVKLTARGAETGSSEVVMSLPGYDGPEVDIAFDPHYLTEMLRSLDGEHTAELHMTDGGKPAVFRVGESYSYLVMPLSG